MQGYAMDSGGVAAQMRQAAIGCYPYGFVSEIKQLFKLAWPTSLSILFHYLIQPVSLMFCGRLGKLDMASAAMAISVIYITCVSVGRGLAFGGDTFFSQVANVWDRELQALNQCLIFGVLCACVIWAVLLNTKTILLLLRQDPDVASLAQEYTQLFMPGALAYCWLFTLMRYLLCQNSVIPNLLVCIASCGTNAILHYCLVFQAEMGIRGSAISLMLTYYLVLFLLVAYIWTSGMYHETWDGWSWECLEDWGPFARVCISSIVMTFIFWLCTEVGTILAGLLGEEDISAFSICFQVEGFAWMIPLGVGGACTARIGQYLGSNQPLGAITTCRVSLTVQLFISLAMGLTCYFLRYFIPLAFTSNRDLVAYTAQIMPLVAIFLLLEGVSGVGVSIIRGAGRQTLGAVVIFVSFYVFALPIGIPLMFTTPLGLSGLWWGYVIGLVVQNVCLVVFVARLNWKDEADAAQIRAGLAVASSVGVDRITDGPADDEIQQQQQQADEETDEPDERTGLLQNASRQTNADNVVVYTGGEQRSVTRLVVLRLLVFAGVLAVVGAGVAVRLFVRVPATKHWILLCMPSLTEAISTRDTSSSSTTAEASHWMSPGAATTTTTTSNTTLQPCRNDTTFDQWPRYFSSDLAASAT